MNVLRVAGVALIASCLIVPDVEARRSVFSGLSNALQSIGKPYRQVKKKKVKLKTIRAKAKSYKKKKRAKKPVAAKIRSERNKSPSGSVKVGDVFFGTASHYGDGDGFNHGPTTCGTEFVASGFTAAMREVKRTIPCFSMAKVCTKRKCVNVRLTDRGPFTKDKTGRYNRLIDVSSGVAEYLGFKQAGVAQVDVQILSLGQ